MWFFIIWFLSCFWAMCFIPWMVERDIHFLPMIFAYICPIFNTVFAVYRTYYHFKNGGSITFIKELFEK